MSLPEAVTLVEVGPRDGLQGQPVTLSVEDRVEMITMLTKAGLSRIEAGSFVPPGRIPPLQDSGKVLSSLKESSARYCVLTPNLHGLNDALAAGAQEVAVFTAVSETFVQKNIRCSINESMGRFQPVVEAAKKAGVLVRGYLSCTMGCPYEGETCLNAVAHIARDLYQLGCYEISMGDTIGVGNPARVNKMIELAGRDVPVHALAVHFHDTYGQAIANIYAAMESGVSVIDTAVAGLGGCPYARGASGNVATEDVLFMLNGMGIQTGVDMYALLRVNEKVCSKLGCSNYSRTAQALLARKTDTRHQ